jgi:hypothetical protein
MWGTRIGDRVELRGRVARVNDRAEADTYVHTPMTATRPGTVVQACFLPATGGGRECFESEVHQRPQSVPAPAATGMAPLPDPLPTPATDPSGRSPGLRLPPGRLIEASADDPSDRFLLRHSGKSAAPGNRSALVSCLNEVSRPREADLHGLVWMRRVDLVR